MLYWKPHHLWRDSSLLKAMFGPGQDRGSGLLNNTVSVLMSGFPCGTLGWFRVGLPYLVDIQNPTPHTCMSYLSLHDRNDLGEKGFILVHSFIAGKAWWHHEGKSGSWMWLSECEKLLHISAKQKTKWKRTWLWSPSPISTALCRPAGSQGQNIQKPPPNNTNSWEQSVKYMSS